jgi:hypothetical protein
MPFQADIDPWVGYNPRILKTASTLGLLIRANLAFFFSRSARGEHHHEPRPPVAVAPDGFGGCVASAEDPACDDYVVARLKELKIRCVRVDYGTGSPGSFVERFVERLLREGFQVALHLVGTKAEVEALVQPEGAKRWRQFVRGAFERFAGAEFFEIGATVNRRRWSGFTIPLFLRAWDVAWEEAQPRRVVLAGPNVTDFEPFYNIPILRALRERGRLPAIHTNNLFVERATEPEAFDHKILGHRCASWIKYNTIKKASLLGAISRWAGVSRTFSTHVSWSLRRIGRVLEDAEEQQADYVTRYCCLAAVSGGLPRVYWGPLIGQREGLIDDGTTFFPEVFHVTFYGRANGTVRDYRLRPAFRAFQAVNQFLSGTTFTRKLPARGSLEILEFQSAEQTLHVVWCRNGDCAAATACYDVGTLNAAEVFDRAGAPLATAPELFTQRPTYLRWKKDTAIRLRPALGTLAGVRLSSDPLAAYAAVEQSDWRGLVLSRRGGETIDPSALLPGRFAPMDSASATVLRNKRNRVWSVPAPWDSGQKLVVKHFRPARGLRGWLQRGKPNKALRSWNGAHELLRRGIPTPRPVAWLEHPHTPRTAESYYLCEAFEGGSSARHAFNAFNTGQNEFIGISKRELYPALAGLLVKMHGRGVFFRDLSAGNLLLRRTEGGQIEFALIDTARVRMGLKSLPVRKRLADLMRLCHPLAWAGREELLRAYFAAAKIRFAPWMRLAFHYYDWKHRVKKQLRPWR